VVVVVLDTSYRCHDGLRRNTEGKSSEVVQRDNVDHDKLKEYARGVAEFFNLPAGTSFIDGGHAAQLFDFSARAMHGARALFVDSAIVPVKKWAVWKVNVQAQP
jgi:hypothetical protein